MYLTCSLQATILRVLALQKRPYSSRAYLVCTVRLQLLQQTPMLYFVASVPDAYNPGENFYYSLPWT